MFCMQPEIDISSFNAVVDYLNTVIIKNVYAWNRPEVKVVTSDLTIIYNI